MVLERLTQITEVGIQSGITLRNINVEGAYVSGVLTATSLNITGGGANFAGVVTATSFSGNVTGNINPNTLNVTGVSTFQASSFWGDGDTAYFGDGQDLLIFHNSTDSIIRDNGTGDLFLQGGNAIRMTNPTGIETYATFNQDGAVELWFDNSKKLETTGYGATVYGVLESQGLQVNSGVSTFNIGPVLIGSGTSTGTASQPLQVTGGAYVSGNLGIGTANPSQKLEVVGGEIKAGRVDSSSEGGQFSLARSTDNATGWYIDVYGNTSTPSLRFVDVSNSAVRATIDGSGRVTMPYQPAFFARPQGGYDISVGETTIAGTWTEVFDRGNNFSNGTFTAPVAGVYQFSWAAFLTNETSRQDAYIMLNGAGIMREEISGYSGTFNRSVTVHGAYQLAANDNITFGVFSTAGNSIYSAVNPWSYACGYLIG